MSFLKKQQPLTKLEVSIPATGADAQKVANCLTALAASLSPSEMELLQKAISNPILKAAALAELRKRVN